jgi:predicted cobalt transporter CbtA
VSRDPRGDGERDGSDDGGPSPTGHVRATSIGVLVGWALVGLVLGWALRPIAIRLNGTAPTVGWLPVLALAFVALVMGSVAWSTHRSVQRRRERLEPHQAVNRLVLGKAGALAGAVVAGGYFGYALAWVGLTESELGQQRMVRALLGGLAGVALVVGSLLLERACRVSGDDA